jgi:putative ABC transport system permease protein
VRILCRRDGSIVLKEKQHNEKYTFQVIALIVLVSVICFAAPDVHAQTEQLPTILITRQLATAEGLRVGDAVALSAASDGTLPRRFRIAGIYEPVPDPMRLAAKRLEARLHLPDLISMTADPSDPLSRESVTAINVALKDPSEASRFAQDVTASIPIPQLNARPTQGGEGTATVFVVLDRFHFAIAVVTIIASTMFLLALMVMLVEERRESVGILRLIGLGKRRILLQVFAEGILIAAAGALFGILFASALQGAVNAFFQWRYDTALVFVRITPDIAMRCVLLSVPLGVLASIVSSWTLLRSNVLDLARR